MQFICSSCKVSQFQVFLQSVGNGAGVLQLGKLRSFGTVWESLKENELDKLKKASVTKRRGIGPIRTEILPYKIRKKLFIF